MEAYLLELGISHTWSKIIPYLLSVLVGILLFRVILKTYKSKRKLALILALVALIFPFSAYFAVNPIYQGDFNQKGKEIDVRNFKTTTLRNGLMVIAIPGCPYCLESIGSLVKMKERKPLLKIEFCVIGTEDKSMLEEYKEAAKGKIDVKLFKNSESMTKQTGGSFPTFVMVEKGKGIYSWTNDEFGVRARDLVEKWS